MSKRTHIVFTKDRLDSLSLPQDGERATYHDSHKLAAGLQLRVTSKGAKTFSIFRRVQKGAPERITIGSYPQLTIDQARRQAAQISAAISDGANPAEAKRAHKAEKTFNDLFDDYLELHSKLNKGTWKEDDAQYKRYLKAPLGSKRLSTIDRQSIAAIHCEITKDGHPTVANRVLALVSSIFGWCIYTGRSDKNPAKGIKRNKETSRDRFLQHDELPRFFKALAEEENSTMSDFFLIALLTGARRANVISMHYNDINFAHAEWRIEKTKNGIPQTVTLSPEAITILQIRKPKKDAGYVFPGEGKSGHIIAPHKAWLRILERANLKNLRPHDLRRTLGSWQAKTGSSLAIIGKSLNHKNVATTAIYARLDLDPVRASVNTATTAMFKAVKSGSKIRKGNTASAKPSRVSRVAPPVDKRHKRNNGSKVKDVL